MEHGKSRDFSRLGPWVYNVRVPDHQDPRIDVYGVGGINLPFL